MANQALPPELIDEIILHCRALEIGAKATLLRCALVNTSWLRPSRIARFCDPMHPVSIDYDAIALTDLLLSPHSSLKYHLRCISLPDGYRPHGAPQSSLEEICSAIIQYGPTLYSLRVSIAARKIPTSVFKLLLASKQTIRELEFCRAGDADSMSFRETLSQLSALACLTLDWPGDTSATPLDGSLPPQTLKTLTINSWADFSGIPPCDMWQKSLLTWLSPSNIDKLVMVEEKDYGQSQTSAIINCLLASPSPFYNKVPQVLLKAGYCRGNLQLDFSHFHSMTSLEVTLKTDEAEVILTFFAGLSTLPATLKTLFICISHAMSQRFFFPSKSLEMELLAFTDSHDDMFICTRLDNLASKGHTKTESDIVAEHFPRLATSIDWIVTARSTRNWEGQPGGSVWEIEMVHSQRDLAEPISSRK